METGEVGSYSVVSLKSAKFALIRWMKQSSALHPYAFVRFGNETDPKGIGKGPVMTWRSRAGADMYATLLNKKAS